MKFAAITASTYIKTITLIMNSTAIITIIAIVVIKANTPITHYSHKSIGSNISNKANNGCHGLMEITSIITSVVLINIYYSH